MPDTAPSLINAAARLRTYLLSKSALDTEVSSRIWVGQIPEDEFGDMPRKSVLIMPSSGPSFFIPLYMERVDCYCYGLTHLEAYDVYRELYNALHRCNLQTVSTTRRLMNAWKAGGPTLQNERVLGWPRVWVAFMTVWAENVMV